MPAVDLAGVLAQRHILDVVPGLDALVPPHQNSDPGCIGLPDLQRGHRIRAGPRRPPGARIGDVAAQAHGLNRMWETGPAREVTLATLFGFDLMPRIRNFADLTFFRASDKVLYPSTDELYGERGRNVIDFKLIERHWRDLMQVAISISQGRLSSATLMRRLRSTSCKNRIYKVFREVGRSVRTVALLRFLSDPQLRARITAATNKVESYNGFSAWLRFGNNGVLADNDPVEQEKLIKLNTLLANLVIFHSALDIADIVRALIAEGWTITAAELAALSPTSAPTSPDSAPTPPTSSGSNLRRSIPPWTRSTSPSWTWPPERRSLRDWLGADGKDLLGVSDGAGDVVQDSAGDALAGGAEDHSGVQAGPAALGLAVQVDGQVDVGEHPRGGRLAHGDAVGGVHERDVGRQRACVLSGDQAERSADPGRGATRSRVCQGAHIQGGDVPAGPHAGQRPGGERLGQGERVGDAAGDGGGVEGPQQPGAGPDHRAVVDESDGFDQFDGASRPQGLHPDLALCQRQAPQDVEGDPGRDRAAAGAVGEVAVDGVDDEAAERAEVLFVGVPGTAGVRGGLVAVLVDGFVVGAGVQRVCSSRAAGPVWWAVGR